MAKVPYLREIQQEIEEYARNFGLEFFETIFEVLDYKRMTEVAAYGGFPVRYPHWRFGMSYDKLQKSHTYGLSQIYELVINNDPCYAYLLEGNSLVIQRLVIGHVLAHCDFFKNNAFFEVTNRKMIDEMANHATRIRRYMERHGVDTVESFIDICLSLENLIDAHSPYIPRAQTGKKEKQRSAEAEKTDSVQEPQRLSGRAYMDSFINPPQVLDEQRKKLTAQHKEELERTPVKPERDVLAFLLHYAPLKPWQRNVLEIVRDEAYYFAPQAMTKFMNEGWATYWHSRIMTEKALNDAQVVDYAEVTAGVTAPSPTQLNPYRLGVALFRNITERWDKGQFGKEWRDCQDMAVKANWDRKIGQGQQKIFEVRRCYNDVTFIDEFFTHDFCREHHFFNFGYNKRRDRWEIESREFGKIKKRVLFMLTNFGQPIIRVVDANHKNRGELLLRHQYEGVELKGDEAHATLENLQKIWNRPVHITTVRDDNPVTLSYDGSTHSESSQSASEG